MTIKNYNIFERDNQCAKFISQDISILLNQIAFHFHNIAKLSKVFQTVILPKPVCLTLESRTLNPKYDRSAYSVREVFNGASVGKNSRQTS